MQYIYIHVYINFCSNSFVWFYLYFQPSWWNSFFSLAVPFVAATLLGLPGDFSSYIDYVKDLHLNPAILTAAKYVLAFPICYHYINGIRHLVSAIGQTGTTWREMFNFHSLWRLWSSAWLILFTVIVIVYCNLALSLKMLPLRRAILITHILCDLLVSRDCLKVLFLLLQAWDWAIGFDLKTTYQSGYFVMALALLVTAGFVHLL